MLTFIVREETEELSFVHSYYPLIKRRVIMLP